MYLQRDLAVREAARWRTALHMPETRNTFTDSVRTLTLIETLFPESWRACPVWIGITWSASSFPKMRGELMAADDDEAAGWLRRQAPKRVKTAGNYVEFERRHVLCAAAIARAKRVLGF